MNRITPNVHEEKSNSEIRRDMRKSFEKGITENEPDKVMFNDIMLTALIIIAAAISFTDFSLSFGSIKKFTALTIFLYVVTTLVYRNRYSKGKQRGKKDTDYIEALSSYNVKLKDIYDKSLAGLVPEFCKEYKVKELREYRENILADIEMPYEEYKEKYWGKPDLEILRLKKSFHIKKALIKCNHAKPMTLFPSLLLDEKGERKRKKLAGQSGQERERIDKRRQIISRGVMVVFGGAIAIDIIFDFSLLTIFQWCVRMLPIVIALITGDDSGYCCLAVTETNFKRDQVSVINLFFEWVKERKEKATLEECADQVKEE